MNLLIIGIKSLFRSNREKERECKFICSLLDTKDLASHAIAIELIKNRYPKWYGWLDYLYIDKDYLNKDSSLVYLTYYHYRNNMPIDLLLNYHYYISYNKKEVIISATGEKGVM